MGFISALINLGWFGAVKWTPATMSSIWPRPDSSPRGRSANAAPMAPWSSIRATTAGSGDQVIGRALVAAGAAGDVIDCFLHGAVLPLAHGA